MNIRLLLALPFSVLLVTVPAIAQAAEPRLAPMAASAKPGWSHAPFEMGDCKVCHSSSDKNKPGKLNKDAQALCLDCHDQFAEQLGKRKHKHEAAGSCVACHNPHNASDARLVHTALPALCLDCHDTDPARHPEAKPAALGLSCVVCHNPHGSDKKALAK